VLGPAAVAAALLQRAADKGVITLAGFAAWFWVQRHIRVRRGLLLGDGDCPPRALRPVLTPLSVPPAAIVRAPEPMPTPPVPVRTPVPVTAPLAALKRPVVAALSARTEALVAQQASRGSTHSP
jgi:hypothetical protein